MSKKDTVISFPLDIWETEIQFTTNQKAAEENITFSLDGENAITLEYPDEKTIRIFVRWVWGIDDPRQLQMIVHECAHAALCVLGQKGVNVDKDNQETFCYTQDYIFRKILDGVKGTGK